MLSPDLVCAHEIEPMSNKLQYKGHGPYCMCADKDRSDEVTGLCTPEHFQFLDDPLEFLSTLPHRLQNQLWF